jgi:uncharacterized membrane protein YedE/YeeE
MTAMNLTKITAGLVSGLLFGAGLAVSGMTNPNKVLNFLDVTGSWDPSLALVMAAAVPVSALSFWLAKRRHRPLLEPGFMLPQNTRLEASLVVGSALFGIGWGLGGYCPGPAVASLAQPNLPLLAFLAAMGAGLFVAGSASRLLTAMTAR